MHSASPSNGALAVALAPRALSAFQARIALVLVGVLLLTISAKIKVPFWPVPMTLQTFAVMAIAAAYGARLGMTTVIAYLAAGLAFLPVFTNTPPLASGPLYFLGSTGGFLIGFIPLAYIVGKAADHGWDRAPLKLFGAMMAAEIVLFTLGFLWLALFAQLANGATGLGFAGAFQHGILPFALGDVLKIALAALLIPAGWALIDRKV